MQPANVNHKCCQTKFLTMSRNNNPGKPIVPEQTQADP